VKSDRAGTNSLAYGACGVVLGLFSSIFLFVFNIMVSSAKETPHIIKMGYYVTALRSVWIIYMPIMVVIGVLYILSGWLLKNKKQKGIAVGIIASILNLFWFAGYAVSVIFKVLPTFPGKLPPIEFQIIVLVIGTVVFCLYPIYFLLTFKRIEI
jgi:hypothetical protein